MKEQLVAKLVANASSGFSEDDKPLLMKMDESALQKLTANCACGGEEHNAQPATQTKAPEGGEGTPSAPQVNSFTAEDAKNLFGGMLQDAMTDLKSNLGASIADAVKANSEAVERAQLLEMLKANDACPIANEQLDAMGTEGLRGVAQMVNPVNYGGIGGPRDSFAANADDVPEMPSLWEN